ncbi:MAG: barstar family protein [Mailhella sp.]|nr:barstar family protein [Mailhella sp.]
MKGRQNAVFFADLDDVKVAAVNGPKSKEDLIAQIYSAFEPKTEAGRNWDALDEVLCDLSWIKQKDIMIVNAGLENLPEKDVRVYADILANASGHWKGRKKHRFFLVLPESMKDLFAE